MAYAEREPPAPLRASVVCLWRRDAVTTAAPGVILPDGCVDLIWESGRGVFLAGPDTRPVPADPGRGQTLRGVRFRPGAGGTLLGLPLDRLRNLRVDMAELHPRAAEALHGALDPEEASRRLVVMAGSFAEQRPPDPVMLAAARLLTDPAARVHELGGLLEISERQLRRRFTAAVGYGPKTLHRVLRFQRFLGLLDAGTPPVGLAELAVRAGYTDQAHLTRESVHFAGSPPAALARGRQTPRHD